MQVVQHTLALQAPRLHDRQDPFHETAAGDAGATETPLTPQHCPAQQALNKVIGRLHAFGSRERPQGRLQGQYVLAKGGDRLVSPQDGAFQQHPLQTMRGMYKICVRTDGHVSDVLVMTSIPGMDQAIIDQIKSSWVYRPQPLPVCAPRVFLFKIN